MTEFKPTYLYIKKCSHCGLLYFGKTTVEEPLKYRGSGKYWKKHLNKHKPLIETIYLELFKDKDLLTEFALFFSEEHNIVNSNKWANLKPENGIAGNPPGTQTTLRGRPSPLKGIKTGRITSGSFKKGHVNSEENIKISSEKNKGNKYGEKNKGKPAHNKGKPSPWLSGPMSQEHKDKISASRTGQTSNRKGKKCSEDHKTKIRVAKSGRKQTQEHKENALAGRMRSRLLKENAQQDNVSDDKK
jgi:hypothetical protein